MGIHRYIEKFVICPQCGLPETVYKIKSEVIWHQCAACGAKEMVDMGHKLCTYILAKNKKKEKKEKKDKKDKKKSKKKEKKSDDEASVQENGGGVDDESAMDLAVKSTQQFIKDNPDASVDEIVDLVVNQQMASALKSFDKIHIIVKALITEKFYTEKEIEKYAPIFNKIINENSIMERHLISALENLCVSQPKNFPVMIKQFYDEDVIDEDNIMEWAGEGRTEFTIVDEDSRANLRGEAEPLVTWLQEADSDSDSDSD